MPIVWIDDEECYSTSKTQIESLEPAAPVLMVRPDERIGISRRQWRLICDFLTIRVVSRLSVWMRRARFAIMRHTWGCEGMANASRGESWD